MISLHTMFLSIALLTGWNKRNSDDQFKLFFITLHYCSFYGKYNILPFTAKLFKGSCCLLVSPKLTVFYLPSGNPNKTSLIKIIIGSTPNSRVTFQFLIYLNSLCLIPFSISPLEVPSPFAFIWHCSLLLKRDSAPT